MATLRPRTSPVKVFLMSGIPDNVRKDLARKIHLLGGKYIDLQDFKALCTHVICGRLSRSEKFLGACATGKWVLHPDYIKDSYIAGCFLDEEQYEFCDDNIAQKYPVDMSLAIAPRRWRFLLGDISSAFTSWKVAVIAGLKRSKVIKRLLLSGGADVYNIKIPVKNPAKVADTIGYMFVSEQNMKSVVRLIDYGVLCIKPEFIGDFLIKDPQPDPMDYLVQVNNHDELPVEAAEPHSQNSFLMESQRSIYLSPQKSTSSQRSDFTPLSSVTSSPASNNRPASKLINESLVKHNLTHATAKLEQPGPSYVIDVDRLNTKVKTEPTDDYGGVINLTNNINANDIVDLTDDNDMVELTDIVVKSGYIENNNKHNVRKSRRDSVKSSPAWKSLIPKRRKTLDADEIDQRNAVQVSVNKEEAEDNLADMFPNSAINFTCDNLKESPENDVNIYASSMEINDTGISDSQNTEQCRLIGKTCATDLIETGETAEDTDRGNVRKSRRSHVKNSPAWKSLIPGRRSSGNLSETVNVEEKNLISAKDKSENKLTDSTVGTGGTSPSGGRQGSAVRCNLSEQLKEVVEQLVTVSSTPLKTPLTKKNLKLAALNMSPITKFFKRIEPTSEITPLQLNKSDLPTQPSTESAMKVEACLNKSACVNDAKTSKISANLFTDYDNKAANAAENFDKDINKKEQNEINQSRHKEVNQPMQEEVNQSRHKDVNLSSHKDEKQSLGKKIPDAKGDRKRKSADAGIVDAVEDGLVTCKRVIRISLTRTPEGRPIVDDLKTASKKKTLTENHPLFSQELAHHHTEDLNDETTTGECAIGEQYAATGRKRKAGDDSKLEEVIVDIKRRKTGICEWCPSMFTADLRESEAVPESVGMSSTTTEMFMATLEDGFTFEALKYLESKISFKHYPQSMVISELLRNVLLTTEDELIANMTYNILSHMLLLHPPVTAALQDVYLRALAGCKEGKEWPVGAEWDLIDQCLSNILVSDDVVLRRNNVLVFRFILQLLQHNLHYLSVSQTDCDTRHVLIRIIWSPSYHVVFNRRCRVLVETMADFIQTYQAKTCDTEKSVLLEVLDGILWMIAMVTDCCRRLECGSIDEIQALSAASTSAFVHEISRKLIEADVREPVLLENIFQGLQLPWLRVGICQKILNTYDDYLVMEDLEQGSKCISLLLIVSRYMYLLPVFDVKQRIQGSNSPARTRTKQLSRAHAIPVSKCLTENKDDMNKENIERINFKVNKKNAKGETPLHVACIRNDVMAVKRLLNVPGIDVNATDNADWTPLHEACNHGNTECVRELLKFVPSKTVDYFFNKDSTVCRKVDLLAGNGEGITPLHDAVINNKLEVCHLLLQHGGPKLLEPKTILGYTPLNLAETDDMATLLSSYMSVRRHDDSFNYTGSQDSTCSTEETVPNDARYDQVIHMDGDRIYVNIKSALNYTHLMTLLVKHYIMVNKLHVICDRMNQNLNEERFPVKRSCQGVSCSKYTGEKHHQTSQKYSDRTCTSERAGPTHGISHVTFTPDRTEQNGYKLPESAVNQEHVRSVKKDIKVLKRMSHYVNSFKNHLLKICRPEDSPVIEEGLQELSLLTETSGHQL